MNESIGIVIPAYQPDIPDLVSYIDALKRTVDPDEIRIELDDPSGIVDVTRLADTGATLHVVGARRGKGAAITHGFDNLDTDVLAFADADGSTAATSVVEVIRALERADLSVGSRRHPESIIESHQTLVRRYLGDGLALVARLLLPVKLYDYQCGAKAISKPAWEGVREHVTETGFAWDIEVVTLVAAMGYDIEEIPVRWHDKPNSTVDPVSTVAELGKALVRAYHTEKVIEGNRVHHRLDEMTPPIKPR